MKSLRLLSVIFIAATIFIACLALLSLQRDSQAQGGNDDEIQIIKTLNKTSNVVRVGELLTFTIALTNHSSFSLTNVTLVDLYRQDILAYAGSVPVADIATTGRIAWSNVATPPILSGQGISVTIAFTAEHPSPAVVNYARAEDVIFWNGQSGLSFTTGISQDAVGGNAPIYKNAWPPEILPIAGSPVTFTHQITNDGAALMTHLPLSDTYEAAFLQFNFAIPTPTIITPPGSLAWDDLTDYFGDLQPFETVIVTTVFTALLDITRTVNKASTEGAQDEYGNNLTAGEGEVPIIIVPQPTNTPTKEPTSKPSNNHHSPTATPTPFPTPTVWPTPTATPPAYPSRLPETGSQTAFSFYHLWGGVILLLGGCLIVRKRNRGNTKPNSG